MRDLIKNSVKQAFESSEKAKEFCDDSKQMMDKMAVKVAIEFCLKTNDPEFLFDELYPTFFDSGTKAGSFHEVLCSLVQANQMTSVKIPECNLKKMVQHYVQLKDLDRLEKMIIKLDMKPYQALDESQAEGCKGNVRAHLEEVCEQNFLINAMIELKITCANAEFDYQGIAKMLNIWFDKICPKSERDQNAHQSRMASRIISKYVEPMDRKRLQTMRNADRKEKQLIE